MLWTIFVVLLVLWLLGVVTSYTLGGFIHILLLLAVIALVFQLITRPKDSRLTRVARLRGQRVTGCAIAVATRTNRREMIAMDNDRIKGKADDVAGRVKRQVGEWTGDTETQAEGAAQQVKGKVENAWGKTKDAVRDATDEAKRNAENENDDCDVIVKSRDVA